MGDICSSHTLKLKSSSPHLLTCGVVQKFLLGVLRVFTSFILKHFSTVLSINIPFGVQGLRPEIRAACAGIWEMDSVLRIFYTILCMLWLASLQWCEQSGRKTFLTPHRNFFDLHDLLCWCNLNRRYSRVESEGPVRFTLSLLFPQWHSPLTAVPTMLSQHQQNLDADIISLAWAMQKILEGSKVVINWAWCCALNITVFP